MKNGFARNWNLEISNMSLRIKNNVNGLASYTHILYTLILRRLKHRFNVKYINIIYNINRGYKHVNI